MHTKRTSSTHPKKRKGQPLGQHFLTRPEIAGWVAHAAALADAPVVLEIGPGHGILTRELLKEVPQVVAVETDGVLMQELSHTFAREVEENRLILIQNDIRDFDPTSLAPSLYTVAANIPYYITGMLLRMFLTTTHQPVHITMLMQKEVAERIVAADGKESLLSLSVKLYGTPKIVRTVKRGSFSPPPQVDSAILTIEHISRNNVQSQSFEECFFSLIHTAFGKKRKQVAHTLSNLPPTSLAACGIPQNARPETIPLSAWLCLTREYEHNQIKE